MNSLSFVFVERLSPSQRYEQLVLCGGAVCPLLRSNKLVGLFLVGQSFHTLYEECIQWNLRIVDTIGTQHIFFLEAALFQRLFCTECVY